jgi:hypothetical protein
MNGVYKYVYENEIIYIGKSDNSIIDRISAHTKEKKFAPYIDKADIYYSPCINSAHTKVVETCLINKYKPILNTIDKYEESFDVGFIEPSWYRISKSYSQSMNMNILLLKGESTCNDLIHKKAEGAYKISFSDSLNEYNKKQTRPCRQIENYYIHIKNGKREAPFYEFRIELKNVKEVSSMLFDNMVDSFKKRNPNFYVFNAGISNDYENIYIYIDFIPFYTQGRIKGLRKGVSMKAALIEQGFHFTSRGVSGTTLWQVRELRENEEVLLQTYIYRQTRLSF